MKNLMLVFALLLAAGCAGTYFKYDDARQVKGGMTEDQVRQIMGNPYTIRLSGPNVFWVYSYSSTFSSGRSVSFMFTNGRVSGLPLIPDSPGR